jgi:ABC-type arginine transport system permease subunit
LNTWPTFLFGITADSLHHLFISVVRGVPQNVMLYAIVFFIAKLLSNLLIIMMFKKRSQAFVK